MADDGSGNFSLPSAAFVSGTTAVAATVNANFSEIATALTARVTRNGTGSMSAALAMGTNRITGLSSGTLRTDAASVAQVQDSAPVWGGTAGGTADALTITLAPVVTAYAAGQTFRFLSGAGANTGAATLNVNGAGVKNIRKLAGSTALVAADIPANTIIEVAYDGTQFILLSVPIFGAVTASGLTIATARLLGRTTAGTGAVEEISAGSGLTLTGGTLDAVVQAQKYVDRAYAAYATNAALSAVFTFTTDNVPAIANGTQVLSVTITPKSVTNRMRIRVQSTGATDLGGAWCMALFANGVSAAIASNWDGGGGDDMRQSVIEFEHVPGATSLQTYTVRVGPVTGSVLRLNGLSSARRGGGTMSASIILEEITP